MPTEAQARHNLEALIADYDRLPPDDRRQMSEASVVRQFIDRLLDEVLGWPIKDPARYKYELHTQAGRPDLTLFPENSGTIFVEAKKFGIIKELEQARKTVAGTITPGQLALPGMAVDRTAEEQQAINYAFANGGTWAILTNFEHFRLFNARRDWLVLAFENPGAYLHDFEHLMQLAYSNVIKGSLDALSNQRHTEEVDTDYLKFINDWRERLARDIVDRRAANPWAFHDDGTINLPTLRAVVQRFLDRLVIIRFAEDHLVIPPGSLRNIYELRRSNPYTFTMDKFIDEFFRRFDEQHNSALFAYGLADEASFSDDALLPLVEKLYEARYRAMPADILGNTYEQYLGKALTAVNGTVTTRDNLETRKKQGSYYTPQVIVRYIVDHSLGRYLYGTQNGQSDGEPIPGEIRQTSQTIRDLRVLDSACGSGSFLIYAYYVLADFYESESARLEREGEARRLELVAEGITSPLDLQIQLTPYTAEMERIGDYPRLILETHLYGVDLDPQAAEIAVVNLMMRAMERRHREKRLPLILNQNVKVGNGLIGVRADDPRMAALAPALAHIRELRAQLVETPNGAEHDAIIADLEAATADLNAVLNADFAPYFADLARVRPFHWGVEFPEVFYQPDGQPLATPGFTIIVGNPPWEIVKPDLREFYAQFDDRIESKLNRTQVETRIAELQAEEPRRQTEFEAQSVAIEQTAAYVRQAADYTRQGRGDTATHKLFLERMYSLLQSAGRIGYVVPSGIYTDLGTKALREMLLDQGNIQYIYSFSNERFFFPGVHHSFKFTLLGAQKGEQRDGFWAAFRFNPRVAVAPDELPAFLANVENLIYVRRQSLERFSPDSLSVMEFQTRRDYEVVEKIYNGWPLIGEQLEKSWNVEFVQDFHITNDRHLFNQNGIGLPLFEGKMIHHFTAEHAAPQYWVEESKGRENLKNAFYLDWYKNYRFAFREIARSTDTRTCIAAILPAKSFATITLWTGKSDTNILNLYIASVLNSFCFDFLTRFRVGTHMTLFLTKQLPLPRLTSGDPYFDAIVPRAARLTCTRPEFADLWRETMGNQWHESDAATDPAERQRLRDEIDALVAHLYGLSRDEFDHILGTFPLVFPDTNAGHARRDALLAVYDALAD
jgi:Eco57I restriction-modification methylase/N-6 DNA Methylase